MPPLLPSPSGHGPTSHARSMSAPALQQRPQEVLSNGDVRALKELLHKLEGQEILTRSSTLSSILNEHRETARAQTKIHEQTDLIYGDPVLTLFFHAFNVELVSLLDGSLILQDVEGRVGVSIEMDTKYEVVTGMASLIGSAVPGLDMLTSTIEKVCSTANRHDFNAINQKLAGVMEPHEIRVFVPSMGRPATLAMRGRLEKLAAQSSSAARLHGIAQSAKDSFEHLQMKIAGTAGGSAFHSKVIQLGRALASRAGLAMANGGTPAAPLLFPQNATLAQRIDLTLRWLCDRMNDEGLDPAMQYDPDEIVVGVADEYVFRVSSQRPLPAEGGPADDAAVPLAAQVAELKLENQSLKARLSALEQRMNTGPAPDAPLTADAGSAIAGLQAALVDLKGQFERDRLAQAEHSLDDASRILTSFLKAQPEADLAGKVVRTERGLERKRDIGGPRTVTEYLEQKYGATRRDERYYTIRHDLADCARAWLKSWGPDLEEQLLEAARKHSHRRSRPL